MTATSALLQGFLELHPIDSARALEALPPEESAGILSGESAVRSAKVFGWLDPDYSASVIRRMKTDAVSQILPALEPVCATSILARLSEEEQNGLLDNLPATSAKELRDLMKYPPDTAGYMMDPRVTFFRSNETVGEALEKIRTYPGRKLLDAYLTDDEGKLLSTVSLRELALAEPHELLGSLPKSQLFSVQALAPRQEVVHLLEQHKLATIPVADFHGRLLGVLRYDSLVSAAQYDATADIQSMVGVSPEERALSSVSFAVSKRLPWLNINLLTAFLAAAVVGLFEETIAKFPVLAVLLPVVAGQSGNTGAQALAVTIRGLALREIYIRDWYRVVWKELAVGCLNGIAIATVTFIGVYFWSGSVGLASVIGIAMIISLIAASFSGAIIPVLLTSCDQDPAQSSSIILTTVTDVAGFTAFLGLATLMSGMLPAG
ncbi:MAG: magnesium transporter [Planctomycetota bacterium]|nr:magnesium transporter [Planctomycetota bacterium]MDA1136946.1 magnesium transporter [Planctomycetota bacterium]